MFISKEKKPSKDFCFQIVFKAYSDDEGKAGKDYLKIIILIRIS